MEYINNEGGGALLLSPSLSIHEWLSGERSSTKLDFSGGKLGRRREMQHHATLYYIVVSS